MAIFGRISDELVLKNKVIILIEISNLYLNIVKEIKFEKENNSNSTKKNRQISQY